MLDSLLQPPRTIYVDQDDLHDWRNHSVTERLMSDLKLMYMDCMLDPIPTKSMESAAIAAIKRDAYREIIDSILGWNPVEVISDGT